MRCLQDTHDVFSSEPLIPGLPSKLHYSAPQQPAYAPRVPQPNIGSLNAVERTHVQSEQKTAQDRHQELSQVLAPQPRTCCCQIYFASSHPHNPACDKRAV